MTYKLNNCPWCDSEIEQVTAHEFGSYQVECWHCDVRGPYVDTEQEAIDGWNALRIQNKEQKEQQEKMLVIFINEGIIDDVTDMDGNPYHNTFVIDYDSAEGGDCPVCNEPLELGADRNICTSCGYDENEDNEYEAIKKVLEAK